MPGADRHPSHTTATIAVTAGRPAPEPGGPMSVPPVLASTYLAGGPVGYGRDGNPTWTALEEAVGALEGGRALAFASGMAAVAAVLDPLPDRSAVVAPRHSYNVTLAVLDDLRARRGFDVRLVDIADTDQTLGALEGAGLLWVESPTNPVLEVADLPALCAAAARRGVATCVDNTFATPVNQQPLGLGADLVVHSATKYLAGHSDVVLGAVVTADDERYDRLLRHRTVRGAVPGPVEAWLALRGVRTLHLRVERAQHNAGELAERLSGHPAIARVRYPGLPGDPGHARAVAQMSGFGAMLGFEPAGGVPVADAVCESTRLWVHATSLGGVESTLERRRRWPAESRTVPEAYVRASVGVEDVEDLWSDLDAALTRTARSAG